MKERINLKAIIAALIIFAIGIFMALMDVYVWKSTSSIVLNIGCSFIASALVSIVTILLVERQKVNPIEEWKLTKVYSTRAEKNADSDPQLDKARYVVDAIAFGLKSFRSKQTKRVEGCLRRGVNFRFITMNPESQFVRQREIEENETEGQIKHTIEELVKWADNLNAKDYKGHILIKGVLMMKYISVHIGTMSVASRQSHINLSKMVKDFLHMLNTSSHFGTMRISVNF